MFFIQRILNLNLWNQINILFHVKNVLFRNNTYSVMKKMPEFLRIYVYHVNIPFIVMMHIIWNQIWNFFFTAFLSGIHTLRKKIGGSILNYEKWFKKTSKKQQKTIKKTKKDIKNTKKAKKKKHQKNWHVLQIQNKKHIVCRIHIKKYKF